MEKRERIVSLVTPSEPCSRLNDLSCVLERLGYHARIHSLCTAHGSGGHHQHGQVLFLTDRAQVNELLAHIRDWPEVPRLAVFAEGVPWERRILDYCAEGVTWPCPQTELLFRLERAFSMFGGQVDDVVSEVSMRLNLIGQAPSFLRALSLIRRIAGYEATVLISGETGTGKELAARAMHYLGHASDGPFVPVNCGGIPDELFENELFGHAPGAYTDAKAKQRGYVEQALGGTLFLDEIDALSLKSQATLLRLLQDQFYKPLGSEQPRHANIRIIAATNTDLQARVEAGQFRQDLMFRLDVLAVELPPLRDRPGDAVRLAEHFVRKFSREYGKTQRPLDPVFIEWINGHAWPGNIRELENAVLRAFLLSEGGQVTHLPVSSNGASDAAPVGLFSEQKARAIAEFERRYLEGLLLQTHGNISLAAKLAGKERRALGRLLQKHGINRTDYLDGGQSSSGPGPW